jgi:hypothetical protein
MEKTIEGILIFLFVVGICLLSAWPTVWMINYIFTPAVLSVVFGGSITFWKAF